MHEIGHLKCSEGAEFFATFRMTEMDWCMGFRLTKVSCLLGRAQMEFVMWRED